jgi:co-chaperonin GroES (HSP10)
MSEKIKKRHAINLEEYGGDTSNLRKIDHARIGAGHKKNVRRINPLGMRVVVRLLKDSNMTEGGLYLPEGAKQSMAESLLAEVVEVASAHDSHTDEETNVSGIPLGARVLILKTAGVKVPWDEDMRIVETKEVLATIDEIALV